MAKLNGVNGGSCGYRYPYRMDGDKWHRYGSKFPRSRGLCDHLVSTCHSEFCVHLWLVREGAYDIRSCITFQGFR